MFWGEACTAEIPLGYYNITKYTTEDYDNDYPKEFDDDIARDTDMYYNDDSAMHSAIALANDFAKTFDRHSAVGVISNMMRSRSNEKFHNSSISPNSSLLTVIVILIVSTGLINQDT